MCKFLMFIINMTGLKGVKWIKRKCIVFYHYTRSLVRLWLADGDWELLVRKFWGIQNKLAFVSILAEPSFMNNSFLFRRCVKNSMGSVFRFENPRVLHWWNKVLNPKIKILFKGSKLIYRNDVSSIMALPNQTLLIPWRKLRSWRGSFDVFTIWTDFACSEDHNNCITPKK